MLPSGFHAHYMNVTCRLFSRRTHHLIVEAVALFFIGTLYPSSDGRGGNPPVENRTEQAQRQIRPDGVYFETICIHVYALDSS